MVALTNRLGENPKPEAPSRGLIVREILSSCLNREESIEVYNSLDPPQYNPHRLFLLDSGGLTMVQKTADSSTRTDLNSGLFYLDNRSEPIVDQSKLSDRLPLNFAELHPGNTDSLEQFCAGHEPLFGRDSICLHAEVAGTLSSSLLLIDPHTETLSYRFSQGAPCESNYQEIFVPPTFQRGVLEAWSTTSVPG